MAKVDYKRLADFLFESSTLKRMPRTGWHILGVSNEDIAQHSWHTAIIGYAVAKLEKADADKVALMLLFHDLPEIRIGDINKLQNYYTTHDEQAAIKDQTVELPFGKDIVSYIDEFNAKKTKESTIAHDADVLALLVRLKELVGQGNKQAEVWFKANRERLRTKTAKELVSYLWETDSQDWWQHIREDLHEN